MTTCPVPVWSIGSTSSSSSVGFAPAPADEVVGFAGARATRPLAAAPPEPFVPGGDDGPSAVIGSSSSWCATAGPFGAGAGGGGAS